MTEAAEGTRSDPGSLLLAAGPRAAEQALLGALAPAIAAARAEPRLLARPVRVVVPSRSLREHLAATLIRAHSGAVVGVAIQTLYAVALEILRRAGEPAAEGTALFPVLVRQLCREEHLLRRGLEGLDDGFAVVEASVSDLLDAGFEAAHSEALDERLMACGEQGAHVERARCVVRVAERAARALEAGRVAHRSGLVRRAREALEGDPTLLPSRALLVHGFAEVTGVQTDLLEVLMRSASATQPSSRGGRGGRGGRSGRAGTIARVIVDEPPDPEEPLRPAPARVFTRRLRERLGQIGGATVMRPDPGRDSGAAPRVSVLHAPGLHAEVRAVAVRLRELLDAGVEPERILVVARDLTPYRVALRLHLTRLAVPFSGLDAVGPRDPSGRRLAALLHLLRRRERTAAERWLDVQERLGRGRARGAPLSTTERADLRLLFHVHGAPRLSDLAEPSAAERFGNRARVRLPCREGLSMDASDSETPDAAHPEPRAPHRSVARDRVEAALGAARAACSRLAAWPTVATLDAHLAALRGVVVDDLGWTPDTPGMRELDEAVLDRETARGFELDAGDFLLFVDRALGLVGSARLGGAGAGVQVLGVMEARGRTADHLFLIGMNRGVFPRTIREDPLIPDALRRPLREVLPDLPVKSDGFDEERYLFAQLLAASPRVTLSCAVSDDDGRARPVSPLVERLAHAEHVAKPTGVASLYGPPARDLAEPVAPPRPAHEQAILAGLYSDRDRFEAVLSLAAAEALRELGVDPSGGPQLAATRRAVIEELDPGFAGRQRLGPYFGFVGPIAEAADPRRAPFFVTTAEALARCPWQTFVSRVLRVTAPPDALAALPGEDQRLLGSVVHAVLDRVVRVSDSRARNTLEAALAATPATLHWPDAAGLEALARDCAEAVLREEAIGLPGYARVLALQALGPLEIARALDRDDSADGVAVLGAEVRGEVVVRDARDRERSVRFRADRIDRVRRAGEAGEVVRLTDFKTGKPANVAQRASSREGGHLARVAQGGLLQSVAYALAAGSASEGRYVYLGPDTPDHARRFPVRADDAAFVEAFHGALRVVLEGWDRGAFFPRLVGPDLELEPRTCTRCATKQACLRGDSGAKGRLVDWMRQRASGRRVGAAEEAVGDVFFLGREP